MEDLTTLRKKLLGPLYDLCMQGNYRITKDQLEIRLKELHKNKTLLNCKDIKEFTKLCSLREVDDSKKLNQSSCLYKSNSTTNIISKPISMVSTKTNTDIKPSSTLSTPAFTNTNNDDEALVKAIMDDNSILVSKLLKQPHTLSSETLIEAIKKGSTLSIIEVFNNNISKVPEENMLMEAVKLNNHELVEHMLRKTDVKISYDCIRFLLQHEDPEMIQIFFDYGYSNGFNPDECLPLLIEAKQYDVLEVFLKKGAIPTEKAFDAAKKFNAPPKIIDLLNSVVKDYSDPDLQDAIDNDNGDLVARLIAQGKIPTIKMIQNAITNHNTNSIISIINSGQIKPDSWIVCDAITSRNKDLISFLLRTDIFIQKQCFDLSFLTQDPELVQTLFNSAKNKGFQPTTEILKQLIQSRNFPIAKIFIQNNVPVDNSILEIAQNNNAPSDIIDMIKQNLK